MSLPVIPSAASLTTVEQVIALGRQVQAWADEATDPGEVREAAAKWAAITEYVRRTSREGVAEAEATLRRLEVRVGDLLGDSPGPGRPTAEMSVTTDISRDERHDFRKMAQHRDVVEQVIAESSDADPPSRRKVLRRIEEAKATAAYAQAVVEDSTWAAGLRDQANHDPHEDRRRQQIDLAVRNAIRGVEALAAFSPDEVRWMLDTSFCHVRDGLIKRLRAAAATLNEVTP